MDAQKTGRLIRKLRLEKGMTQLELAGRLHVSDKAVSKWERAQGCPDVSILRDLASALEVDIGTLLEGAMNPNESDGGNMRRIRFFVCPECGNVLTMTGEAQVSCCGRALEALKPVPCDQAHSVSLEPMDGEIYASFDHGMDKAHYIRFIACVGYERVLLVRLYPEQGNGVRLPYMPRCTYYICCSKEGLYTFKS